MAKSIEFVKVRREVDDSPDLSYLGEYTNDYEDGAIDRFPDGEKNRCEFRYFVPTNPEYAQADFDRAEAYNDGDWCMVGIWAEAEIVLCDRITQKIRSGGLWGVESDGDGKYLAEIEREQLAELRAELEAMGFSEEDISEAFEEVEAA